VWTTPAAPIAVNSHAYGTTRMGADPATSVVDSWCLSHEVPNLAILGGSTFPTSTGYNPTNTIEALAWRTGDHIAKDWKKLVS
jgi:gluconate 2-dehydrogenase alpha chain